VCIPTIGEKRLHYCLRKEIEKFLIMQWKGVLINVMYINYYIEPVGGRSGFNSSSYEVEIIYNSRLSWFPS
jgi:hypothetical protein